MGVFGLWRLLDATGKPVPLETLEGKVLAIDVSIWIHQVLQGYQDRQGNPKPNAHLLGLFHRICKLYHYKIKPVFVFDGGVPMLKKNTIAQRRKQKSIASSKAEKMKTELINNIIKHNVVNTVLKADSQGDESTATQMPAQLQSKPTVYDMFKLPDMPATNQAEIEISDEYDSDCSTSSSSLLSPRKQTKWAGNIHNVDVSTAEFKTLPADVRYDILTDLKETRKQNSWGRLHEMPQESHDFSGFQMKRLLKRRFVQESLEVAEKEMGGKTLTLEELEKLLTEQGIGTKGCDFGFRIAADSTTRLMYIRDNNALAKGGPVEGNEGEEEPAEKADKDEPVAGPSKAGQILEDMNEYQFNDDWDSDVEITNSSGIATALDDTFGYGDDSDVASVAESIQSCPVPRKAFGKDFGNPALTYMLEYSGLSQEQILTLLEQSGDKDKDTQNAAADSGESSKLRKQNNVENSEFQLPAVQEEPKLKDGHNKLSESEITFDRLMSTRTANGAVTSRAIDVHAISDTEDDAKETTSQQRDSPASVIRKMIVDTITDTDSDDFVEIQDVPIPYTRSIKTDIPKSSIQITFRSDEKIQDDIFADVFESADLEASVPKNVRSTVNSNIRTVKSPQVDTIAKDLVCDTTIDSLVSTAKHTAFAITKSGEDGRDKPSSSIPNENDTEDSGEGFTESNSQQDDAIIINELKDVEKSTEPIISQNSVDLELNSERPKAADPGQIPMNEEELQLLKARLENEQEELAANIGKLERQATDISDQIRIEAQELLRLFGIPYIVAPMEAEAQCAYLEQVHLTDGTITDDSDIWLFGGQCVYKNFFNHEKRVLRFRSCDIQHHFKLTRNEMIQLALLVGSDYTTGVSGIGPVTALEILAAFPTQGDNLLHGLLNFCSWINGGRVVGPGKAGLRTKLRNMKLEKGFPSQAVVQAYLFPTIDESKETFTWGKPNITLLSDYTKKKFGWTRLRFDDTMDPILKRLEEKTSQKTIEMYFKLQATPKSIEPNLSKRVQKAVQRLNNGNAEDVEEASTVQPRVKKSRPRAAKKIEQNSMKTLLEAELEEGLGKTQEGPKKGLLETTVTIKKLKTDKVAAKDGPIVPEFIPQREKDKAAALKKKLHAIEVLRKSKQGLCKTKKVRRCVRTMKKDAELSESDSSS